MGEAEWFRAYAQAMQAIQFFERDLTYLLWSYRLTESESRKVDIESEITMDLDRRSLGKIINQTRQRAGADAAVYVSFFEEIKRLRDFIAHHYFRLIGYGPPIENTLLAQLASITLIFTAARDFVLRLLSDRGGGEEELLEDPRVKKALVATYSKKIVAVDGSVRFCLSFVNANP